MKRKLALLLKKCQSDDLKVAENALLDLRLIIEINTHNKFSEEYFEEYDTLFNDFTLAQIRLSENNLFSIKCFLFYLAISYRDRAVLIARCIKVLLDKSTWPAICSIILLYKEENDNATVELIYSITNHDDWSFIDNSTVMSTFLEVSRCKNTMARKVIQELFQYYKRYKDKNFDFIID